MGFFSLRFEDVLVVTHTLWLLARIAILRRVLSLPGLVRRLDRRGERATPLELDRLVWLTRRLLRLIYGKHFCLQQTLVLFHLLRKANYPVRFHVGVVKQEGRLTGHAWLDLNGQPVVEDQDPSFVYKTTFSYPIS